MSDNKPVLSITKVDYKNRIVHAELDYGPGYELALAGLGLLSDHGRVLPVEANFYFQAMDDSATLVLDGEAWVVHPERANTDISFEAVGLDSMHLDDLLAEYAYENAYDVDYEYRSGPGAARADAAYDAWVDAQAEAAFEKGAK